MNWIEAFKNIDDETMNLIIISFIHYFIIGAHMRARAGAEWQLPQGACISLINTQVRQWITAHELQ